MTRTSLPSRALSAMLAFVLACAAVPVSAPSTAYGAGTAYVNQYSITAPIYITFGGDEPYDIAYPQHSLTQACKFENSGSERAAIYEMDCTEYAAGSIRSILEEADEAGLSLEDQKLFSVWNSTANGGTINFNQNNNGNNGFKFGAATFTDASNAGNGMTNYYSIPGGAIGAPGTLECTYRLNLTNVYEVEGANAKVSESAIPSTAKTADAAVYYPLAKLKYTFAPGDFYFCYRDQNDDLQVKTFAEVKNDAITIAKAAEATGQFDPYAETDCTGNATYDLYKYLRSNPDKYTMAINDPTTQTGTLAGSAIFLKIIGINHDNAVAGGKAGLTLMASTNTGDSAIHHATGNVALNTGGWAYSDMRLQQMASGKPLFNRLFTSQSMTYICPVVKQTRITVNGAATVVANLQSRTTEDGLFLLSAMEFGGFSGINTSAYPATAAQAFNAQNDGFQYAYFADGSTRLAHGTMWLRSGGWAAEANKENTNFMYVTTEGIVDGGVTGNIARPIYPAFCL